MRPVVEAAEACHDKYGVAGVARMAITVFDDGTAKFEQTGDFVDSPTAQCLDKAMRKVVFPEARRRVACRLSTPSLSVVASSSTRCGTTTSR